MTTQKELLTEEKLEIVEVDSMSDLSAVCSCLSEIFKLQCADPITMKETVMSGGYCLAVKSDSQVVGGAWGIPGFDEQGRYFRAVWGGVEREHNNAGVGTALAYAQAEACQVRGAERLRWTFDPLNARRAHLFINKFGGVIDGYAVNCFGELEGELGPQTGNPSPSDRVHATKYVNSDRTSPTSTQTVVEITPPSKQNEVSVTAALEDMRSNLKPHLDEGMVAHSVSITETTVAYHLI